MHDRNRRAYKHLGEQPWAERLIAEIDRRGGISNKADEGDLFTLRFGWELSLACPNADITYEFRAGVGETSVDFLLHVGGRRWLFECKAMNDSQMAKRMQESTREELGPRASVCWIDFDGSSPDRQARPEAELHRVSQAIWQHVWRSDRGNSGTGTYTKFPERSREIANVLVVNMAGLEGIGQPEEDQCKEIAYGSATIPAMWRYGEFPGLFNSSNPDPGAVAVRERVDLLVFIDDVHGIYDDAEIRRSSYLAANPSSQGWVTAEYPMRLNSPMKQL